MTTINDKIKNGEVYISSTKTHDIYGPVQKNPFNTLHKGAEGWKSDATIESVCDALKEFLLAKNKNYGNSATEPVRVFSKCNANEGILVRMDDKLSRIKNSESLKRNDIVDLAGYLVLLMKNNGWDSFMDMVD